MKYGLNFWKMQWSLGQWACKTCLLGAKRALCVVPENALIQLIRPVAAWSSISRARAESHTSEKLKSCNCFWHQSHLRFWAEMKELSLEEIASARIVFQTDSFVFSILKVFYPNTDIASVASKPNKILEKCNFLKAHFFTIRKWDFSNFVNLLEIIINLCRRRKYSNIRKEIAPLSSYFQG